jgi:hypothetical protein
MSAADERDEVDETQGGDGAAVFPMIPEELQINPLLLALLHAVVFVDGSTEEIIDPGAADEAVQYVVTYLQRLKGPALERIEEDMDCLIDFAKQQDWPEQQLTFLKAFLADYGIASKE